MWSSVQYGRVTSISRREDRPPPQLKGLLSSNRKSPGAPKIYQDRRLQSEVPQAGAEALKREAPKTGGFEKKFSTRKLWAMRIRPKARVKGAWKLPKAVPARKPTMAPEGTCDMSRRSVGVLFERALLQPESTSFSKSVRGRLRERAKDVRRSPSLWIGCHSPRFHQALHAVAADRFEFSLSCPDGIQGRDATLPAPFSGSPLAKN